MMRHYDQLGCTNWVSHIRNLLYVNGLIDLYLQCWFSDIILSSKLCSYSSFKFSYIHESYLDAAKVRKFRRAIASLRTSSHKLEVERSRHFNLPRNERTGKFCNLVIKDEYHFLILCPLYQDLRKTFLPDEYVHVVNFHKFIQL